MEMQLYKNQFCISNGVGYQLRNVQPGGGNSPPPPQGDGRWVKLIEVYARSEHMLATWHDKWQYRLQQKLWSPSRFVFIALNLIGRQWPSGCSHTPNDPNWPCAAGGHQVILRPVMKNQVKSKLVESCLRDAAGSGRTAARVASDWGVPAWPVCRRSDQNFDSWQCLDEWKLLMKKS